MDYFLNDWKSPNLWVLGFFFIFFKLECWSGQSKMRISVDSWNGPTWEFQVFSPFFQNFIIGLFGAKSRLSKDDWWAVGSWIDIRWPSDREWSVGLVWAKFFLRKKKYYMGTFLFCTFNAVIWEIRGGASLVNGGCLWGLFIIISEGCRSSLFQKRKKRFTIFL